MIDIFIVIVLLWAAWRGWQAGLLKEVVSTVGFLVGLFVAASCYSAFGEYLAVNGSETNMVTSIIAFLLLWIAVPIVLGLVANILTKALKGMSLGLPNSILGALVGLLKYFILLSCVFNAMTALHIMNEEKTAESHLYQPVTGVLNLFFGNDSTEVAPQNSYEEKNDTVWIDMRKGKDSKK